MRNNVGWIAFVVLALFAWGQSAQCEPKKPATVKVEPAKPAPIQAPIKHPEGEPDRVKIDAVKVEPVQAPSVDCAGGFCSTREVRQVRPIRRLFRR